MKRLLLYLVSSLFVFSCGAWKPEVRAEINPSYGVTSPYDSNMFIFYNTQFPQRYFLTIPQFQVPAFGNDWYRAHLWRFDQRWRLDPPVIIAPPPSRVKTPRGERPKPRAPRNYQPRRQGNSRGYNGAIPTPNTPSYAPSPRTPNTSGRKINKNNQ